MAYLLACCMPAQALVASPGKGMQLDRIQLAAELWAAGIAAEYGSKANPNFKDSLQYADDHGIPFVLVLGESEKQEVRVHRLPACIAAAPQCSAGLIRVARGFR